MNEETKEQIRNHIKETMNRLIHRRCIIEPFDENDVFTSNPFGARLIPIEVWKGSKFERSFVTALGRGIFEALGKIIARGTGSIAENQHHVELNICTWRIEKIEQILAEQRASERAPNWAQEVEDILQLSNNSYTSVSVTSDLYIKRPNGLEEFYSFKTVKPNLDQTERAKRDMFRLIAGSENKYKPFFALPYNPAGEGKSYRKAWSIPYGMFNMDEDESVLIGSKLWNHIGGTSTIYDELLNIFEEVGRECISIIKKEYFKIG